MAIAGKVAITPKGEWNSVSTYEKLDAVSHNNGLYIAKKASSGIIPEDGDVWMFAVESIDMTEFNKIIDGTTIVGEATKAAQDGNGNNIVNTYHTKTGDSKDNTVSFTSADSTSPTAWTDVAVLASGEKHSSLFNKISTMFKNIRWLYKILGTTDISGIGNGTATGGLSALNSNLVEQKILGWTVPKECPIQNYVDSDGVYHQIVGRVDLGSLYWYYKSNRFYTALEGGKYTSNYNGVDAYCYKFNNVKDKLHSTFDNKEFSIGSNFVSNSTCAILIRDDSYTNESAFKIAMQGVYLYYELEIPITMTIDGNEAIEKANESLDDYGLNNKFDGTLNQGYDANGSIMEDNMYVCSNRIPCTVGGIVNIETENNNKESYIAWYNGTTYNGRVTISASNEIKAIVPSDVTHFRFSIGNSNGITPTTAGHIGVYVDNAIDELKNDFFGYEIPNGTDLDTLTRNGIFTLTYGHTYPNAPDTSCGHGIIINNYGTSDQSNQILIGAKIGMYYRRKYGSSFDSWVKLA